MGLVFYGIGAFFSAYLGYLFGGVYYEGITLPELIPALEVVLQEPFAMYWNKGSPKMILVFLLIYIVGIFMYLSSRIELMAGREHGTARLEPPKRANKRTADKDDRNNMIITQNVKLSMDNQKLKLNSNMLVIGGSGSGKSFYVVTPNVLNLPNASLVFTDPKGELLGNLGHTLKKNGYVIKVLNLVEMEKSDCFNPFMYIRDETDIIKLINNLIANTTPKGASQADPFWEKSESMFLQALMLYIWMEEPRERQNFNTLLDLLSKAEVNDKGKSELDIIMDELRASSDMGYDHPAVRAYDKCVGGAGDTVRSIIISAHSRLAFFENPKVRRILSRDDMDLASIGIGVDGDKKTKTALFCVISDSDKSFNFIIGMLYSLLIQTLYFEADFHYKGKLPIHVSFWLDEAANVPLPSNGNEGGAGGYASLLSSMRGRNINSVTVVQNVSQLKAIFKDGWEIIPGCSDEILYLGGNESESHAYISKLLGKATINKRSHGESRGRNGSSSRNTDVLGRELLMPDEVRKIDNKKCILFIRGFNPIIDDKFDTMGHPLFNQSGGGGGQWFEHEPQKEKPKPMFFDNNSYTYFVRQKKEGKNVFVNELTMKEFVDIGKVITAGRDEAISFKLERIMELLSKYSFSKEQMKEINTGIENGLSQDDILQYAKQDYSANRMKQMRLVLEADLETK